MTTAARIEAFAPYELDSPYVPVPFIPLQMVDGQYPLKHVIPPPSPGTVKRRKLIEESDVLYSHPLQRPPDPKFDGSLPDFLSSFISLEDDIDLEPPPPEEELEARAENELEILAAVEEIRAEGRELYDPEQGEPEEWSKPKDHQDWLVEHSVYFAGLVAQERKSHIALAKKMARMVTKHFEEIQGKEDRELREIEKNQKALARWTVREIKKKWKLAIGVSFSPLLVTLLRHNLLISFSVGRSSETEGSSSRRTEATRQGATRQNAQQINFDASSPTGRNGWRRIWNR